MDNLNDSPDPHRRPWKYEPEYHAWKGMKARCLNPQNPRYPRYGGRGITIAPRWLDSYEAFLADVGRRPSPRHSVDRIDNDGPYAPGNVRWSTRRQQARNKKRKPAPRRVDDGALMDVATVAVYLGTSPHTISARVARGMLPYRHWGGRIVFVRAEIDSFLASLPGVDVPAALANVKARQGTS